uniref:SH2 domain-containing protein n=1 Tax=Cyprinodon variegatus TaxID=28743 RepID=A0A3Q2CHY2_CYPVA
PRIISNVSAKQLILFQDGDVYNKPWFASTCDRKTADDALLRSNMDGAFLVRKSSGQDVQQPYTLVVFYNGRVYNIPIRFVPSTRQYALGREKKGEEVQLRLLKYLHLYVHKMYFSSRKQVCILFDKRK